MLAGDATFYKKCVPTRSEDWMRTYYKGMSQAFARLARGSATVVHKDADYSSPPMDGIYGTVELPTLQNWTDITEVRMIAAPGTNMRRADSATTDLDDERAGDQKRSIHRADQRQMGKAGRAKYVEYVTASKGSRSCDT